MNESYKKKINLLSDIALLFIDLNNIEEKMDKAIEMLGQVMNADRSYIFIDSADGAYTSNRNEWCSQGIRRRKQDLQTVTYDNLPSWKKMLKDSGKIYAGDVNELPEDLKKLMESEEIKSVLIYPVIISKKIRGFVGIDFCRETQKCEDSDLHIVSLVAGIISNAFDKKVNEDKVQISEKNFKQFFETITDMFFIVDKEGKLLFVNRAVCERTGFSQEEITGMSLMDMHPAQHRNNVMPLIGEMIRGEKETCFVNMYDKKGRFFPTETRVWKGTWDDKECIFGVMKDRSQEVENLRLFKSLFENNPTPMSIVDMKTKRFLRVNEAYRNLFGYSEEELEKMTSNELHFFITDDYRKELQEKLHRDKNFREVELQFQRKDGKVIDGLFSVEMIENQESESYLTVVVDITEQKKLTHKIQEQNNRLSSVIEAARLGTWEWNMKTGETIFNERWAEILGYKLEELGPINIYVWNKLTHPDDLVKSKEMLKKHVETSSFKYDIEIRMRHKNGKWIWVHTRGRVVEYDNSGNPVKMFGIQTDISAKKKTMDAIRESEKRFMLALDKANAGLWDWDSETGKIYFSPLWKSMLGYEEDEIEDSFMGWRKLWHPEDSAIIEKAFLECRSGKEENLEFLHRLKHKSGEWHWILTRGGILNSEDRDMGRWIGTNFDITKQREASLALERFFSINLDMLCIISRSGQFIKANPAWEEVLGYEIGELEGENIFDFLHPEDLESTREIIQRQNENGCVIDFVCRCYCKDGSYKYVEWRTSPYEDLIYGAARDITKRIEYENKILEISTKDPLTNIYNRRYFFEKSHNLLQEFLESGENFSIALIDIDHFKIINDTYGHPFGDWIIKEMVTLINENIKRDDLIGRYGGEEFLLAFRSQGKEKAGKFLDKIREKIAKHKFVNGEVEVHVTFSAGISDCREINSDTPDVVHLVEIADERLYHAKSAGRNKIIL